MKFTTEKIRQLHEQGYVSDEFLNHMEQMSEVLEKEDKIQEDSALLASVEEKEKEDEEFER